MEKLLLIHPADNVLIVRKNLLPGDTETIHGSPVVFTTHVNVGHKIAARDFKSGDKVIKYGVPIGSVTEAVRKGEHIHLHNMKSDYIATYTYENQFKNEH